MIKLYIYCPVLIIGNVEVGLDIGMKFHQEVMEIVSYDRPISDILHDINSIKLNKKYVKTCNATVHFKIHYYIQIIQLLLVGIMFHNIFLHQYISSHWLPTMGTDV